MRILHTADWHLGANLERFSRIEEQAAMISGIVKVARDEGADLLLLSGDVYDSANPSAMAEGLFYHAMAELSAVCPVVIVAGNHDSHERLAAPLPLGQRLGIDIITSPSATALRYNIGGQELYIAPLPYITERRLGQNFMPKDFGASEAEFQQHFSKKVAAILRSQAQAFKADAVNIAMGHFHIRGGAISAGAERDIQLGGVFAVDAAAFEGVEHLQYVAMGHLHRPQTVGTAHYAGSPMPYSLNEAAYPHGVNMVDISPRAQPKVTFIPLQTHRPILPMTFEHVDAALQGLAQADEGALIYVRISKMPFIAASDIQAIRSAHPHVIDISLTSQKNNISQTPSTTEVKGILEEFVNFYTHGRGEAPSADVLKMFSDICNND